MISEHVDAPKALCFKVQDIFNAIIINRERETPWLEVQDLSDAQNNPYFEDLSLKGVES
jgi:hypothetical protein